MTRQYIGARYVPRFTGTYDPTQAYEALDVVDNGSGTSYIAKVPTPPNIPLNNTNYWFVYGASSGAIVDLQNRMNAVETGKNNKSELDVANFPGDTPEEKLHAALDYAKDNGYHYILTCNDVIEVTESYNLYDPDVGDDYENSFSTVIITGAKFVFNGVPAFTGESNEDVFVPTFDNCIFDANVGDYVLDSTILTNYINPAFMDCIFYHVGVINNSAVDNSVFVQSPHFIGCKVFRMNVPFLKTATIWNGVFDSCQFEASADNIINITRTINEMTIKGCVFEGFLGASPIVINRGALNVSIRDNYFERNRPHSIEIGNDYIYYVEISGNSFYVGDDRETPIDITGNTSNANIVVSDNNLMVGNADDYLANFEPYSAARFGYHNKKWVAGVANRTVYPGRTTLGFQAGWNQELTDWSYDSGNNCYKCTFDFYGQLNLRAPFLMGCIRGLSRAASSTVYNLTAIFTIIVIGAKVDNVDGYYLQVKKLNNAVGNSSGVHDDDVTISATLATDPDDSTHHTITINVTCASGSYFGTGLNGRVFDLMEAGVIERTHT